MYHGDDNEDILLIISYLGVCHIFSHSTLIEDCGLRIQYFYNSKDFQGVKNKI